MEEFNKDYLNEKNDNTIETQNCYYKQSQVSSNLSEDIKFVQYPRTPKTKNGLIVFIIFLSILAFISFISILSALFVNVEDAQDAINSTTVDSATPTTTTKSSAVTTTRPYDQNRPELIISGTPEREAYTAVEVAEKISPSMVSLLVYQNGVLISTGSGVVMTDDGYIITCAHIVNKSGDSLYYRVKLYNNTEYDAQVIGYDDKTDIAVVKIEANGLKPAEFASSENLKSGQDILAIGSPGGLEFAGSITDGIISSPNRYITKEGVSNFRVIQHTAAINPGNSGGALVNMYGQVVGINSAKMMSVEYEGMGFATSISYAKIVIDDIIQYGTVVRRGRLAIEYLQFDYTSDYAIVVRDNSLPSASIVVENIYEASDLFNSKVQKGDFLIGVNGQELTNLDILFDAVYSAVVGDTITLEFFRPDTKEAFEVTCKFVS